jgi:hypothetical protein
MRVRLRIMWRRRGYGFEGLSFHEAAANIIQAELARLLWLPPSALHGGEPFPGLRMERFPSSALRPQLERLCAKTSWTRCSSLPLVDLEATTLADLYGRLLWFKAERGLEEEWRRQHSQEARILRGLKRQIRLQDRTAIRINWEPQRGKLVVTRGSRASQRAMEVTEIIGVIEGGWFGTGLSGVVESLRDGMRPERGHGGYCRLMDLLRAVVVLCGLEAREPPGGPDRETERDHLENWKQRLHDKAVEILEADLREKPAGWIARDPGVRKAWIEIAADWIPHKVGLGRSEWSDLTLDEIIREALPEAHPSGTLPLHRDGINYLIRRILLWFRRKGRRWFDL